MKTDEKNPVFDIRDTLEKYACIYRNTTLKLFQYCQETDIYERLDEYLSCLLYTSDAADE